MAATVVGEAAFDEGGGRAFGVEGDISEVTEMSDESAAPECLGHCPLVEAPNGSAMEGDGAGQAGGAGAPPGQDGVGGGWGAESAVLDDMAMQGGMHDGAGSMGGVEEDGGQASNCSGESSGRGLGQGGKPSSSGQGGGRRVDSAEDRGGAMQEKEHEIAEQPLTAVDQVERPMVLPQAEP